MSTNPIKEIVKPENSIFKGTEMIYCPNHGESFEEFADTSLECKNFKSNKKADIWEAGCQLWHDWDGLKEDYTDQGEWVKDLKKERDREKANAWCENSRNKRLEKENEALKEQINKQHEELQEIKNKLKELLK